jgi:hypothetical protein
MTFQNLIFGSRTNGYLVYVERSCDFCVFTNNLFDNEFRTGNALNWNAPATKPFGDAGSDNLFINNTFTHGLGSVALAMFGDRNEVRGNLFYNSDSIDFMRIFGRSNHIIGNTFSNVYESGASGNHIDFFQLFGTQGYGARGHIIENNIVTDMSESSQLCMMTADDIVDIQDITFRNNLFVGVAAKGTICIRNVKWYNNMFYNCSTTALTAGHALIFISLTNATYTNFLSNAAHGCEVKNNAFISCGDARTTVGWYSFTLDLTNIVADYNIVSKNGYNPVTTNTLHRPIGGTNAWDSLKWWEDHGINGGNPQYTDPPGMDFRFPEGSIVRGVALEMNSLFTTDFYGTVRGDEWDIGPIEFNGDAPPLICVPYY